MDKHYNSEIIEIARMIIKKAEDYHKKGKLIEAANMIRKAGDVFLPEYEENPRNKAMLELKSLYDKISTMITNSMIKVLPAKPIINQTKTDKK